MSWLHRPVEFGPCASDRYFRGHLGKLRVLPRSAEFGVVAVAAPAAASTAVVASAGAVLVAAYDAASEWARVVVVAVTLGSSVCCSLPAMPHDTSGDQGAANNLGGGG